MVRWICIQNLLVDLILAQDLNHYCFLVCDYLSADLISIIFTSLAYFTFAWFSIILYGFGSRYPTGLLRIHKVCESILSQGFFCAKVCGFILPQDFFLRQGLLVSSSTGLLPLPSFVGFFSPQDFISQCQVLWVSSPTGLYLPMLSFVGFFIPQDFMSQC